MATDSPMLITNISVDFAVMALTIYGTVCHGLSMLFFWRTNHYHHQMPHSWNTTMNERTRNITLSVAWATALSSMIVTLVGYYDETPLLYTTNYLLSGFALVSTYFAFWSILRMFYSESAVLTHLTNNVTQFLSYFQGVFMIIACLMLTVVFVQQGIEKKCVVISCFPVWTRLLVLAGQLETHIVLVVLFNYPLLRHRALMRRGMNEHLYRLKYCSASLSSNNERIIVLMKKVAFATALSSFTDIAAFAYSWKFNHGYMYNIDVLFNLVCLTLCHSDWRRRLLPTLPRRNKLIDVFV